MFWLELLVVLAALALGARLGGIFLGIAGGLGLAFLVFVFGLAPSAPPIDVMLIITAVIVAASVLQVAGGMDYLVSVAEKILRSNPKYITFLAPMVCYLFTFMAGTGNIAFALLPVIAEVARETGVRPERPMSISVVASQQAITASPVSAAMAALVALLSPLRVRTLLQPMDAVVGHRQAVENPRRVPAHTRGLLLSRCLVGGHCVLLS